MIKKYCIYEVRIPKQLITGSKFSSDILSTADPNHSKIEYNYCKCIPILDNNGTTNWYCHIIEDLSINSTEQQALLTKYQPFRVNAFTCSRLSLDNMHIGKLILEISEKFLWPSLEEVQTRVSLSKPKGMTCNNPMCQEHFPWADSPNIGEKFLCYSCRTNPTTRIILGY